MSSVGKKEDEGGRRKKGRGKRVRRKGYGKYGYGYGTYGELFLGGYTSAITPKLVLKNALSRLWRRVKSPAVLAPAAVLLVLMVLALRMMYSTWTVSTLGGNGSATVKGRDWIRAKATLARLEMGGMGLGKGNSVASAMRIAGNYPWNDDLQREALAAILRSPGNIDAVSAAGVGERARWFLQVTNSGQELRHMGRRALLDTEQFDEVPGVWDPAEALEPEDVTAALVAALAASHPEVVPLLWSRLPENVRQDETFRDCHVAWEAGWSVGPRGNAVQEVRRWISSGPWSEESLERRLRLALLTAVGNMDHALGSTAMSSLTRMAKDRTSDHVAYWDLLGSVGRGEEVARLASAMGARPAVTAGGAVIMAAWAKHGLPQLGAEALTRFPEIAEVPHPFPMTIARGFIEAGRWSDLGRFASKVGNGRSGRDFRWNKQRVPYAAFLDALAANGSEIANLDQSFSGRGSRREIMESRLRIVIDSAPTDDVVATDMASILEALGYPEFGRRVLDLAVATKTSSIHAWRKMAWVARRAGMDDVTLAASSRLLEIAPDVPMHRWYFLEANAQSVSRDRKPPAKALEILKGVQPPLLHEFYRAIAMAKAGMNREAAALLATLPSSGLDPRESSWRNIALIEADAHGGGPDHVKRLAEGVAMGCLSKARQKWIQGFLGSPAKVGVEPPIDAP